MRNNPIIEGFVPDISRFRFLNNKFQKWISVRNSDEYKLISNVRDRCNSFFNFSSGLKMMGEMVRCAQDIRHYRHLISSGEELLSFSILAGLSSTLSFPAALVNCYIFDSSLITPIVLGIGMCASAVAAQVSSRFLSRVERPTLMEECEFRFVHYDIYQNQMQYDSSRIIARRVEDLKNGLPPRKAEESGGREHMRKEFMSGRAQGVYRG